MAVKSATGHDHAYTETKSISPFRAKITHRLIRGFSLIEEFGSPPGKKRINSSEELLRRKSTPFLAPHRLMSLGASTTDNVLMVGHTGQNSREPFTALHDSARLGGYLRRIPQDMQGLGPEPLGTVDSALVHGIVDRGGFACLVDLRGFLDRGVILP